MRRGCPAAATQTYSVGVNDDEGTTPSTPSTPSVRIDCGDELRGTYTRRLNGTTALNP